MPRSWTGKTETYAAHVPATPGRPVERRTLNLLYVSLHCHERTKVEIANDRVVEARSCVPSPAQVFHCIALMLI